MPGASEVKTAVADINSGSSSRNTAFTPTSGKKVRIISVCIASAVTTNPDRIGVYFGTGATYTTGSGKQICEVVPGTNGSKELVWPDGGGPVGAADDVVSWIIETETETTLRITLNYREE